MRLNRNNQEYYKPDKEIMNEYFISLIKSIQEGKK